MTHISWRVLLGLVYSTFLLAQGTVRFIQGPGIISKGKTAKFILPGDSQDSGSYTWQLVNASGSIIYVSTSASSVAASGVQTEGSVVGSQPGQYTLQVQISRVGGGTVTINRTLTVVDVPNVTISGPSKATVGDEIEVSVPLQAGASYEWFAPLGCILRPVSGSPNRARVDLKNFKVDSPGLLPIRVRVSNAAQSFGIAYGTNDSAIAEGVLNISIYNRPNASIVVSSLVNGAVSCLQAGQSGSNGSFYASSSRTGDTSSYSYSWVVENGTISSPNSIGTLVSPLSPDRPVELTLTVRNPAGAVAVSKVAVPVRAVPFRPVISSVGSVERGSVYTASVPQQAATVKYNWSGSNVQIIEGHDSPSIRFFAWSRGSAYLSCLAYDDIGTEVYSSQLAVPVMGPDPVGFTDAPVTMGTSRIFAITGIMGDPSNYSYHWSCSSTAAMQDADSPTNTLVVGPGMGLSIGDAVTVTCIASPKKPALSVGNLSATVVIIAPSNPNVTLMGGGSVTLGDTVRLTYSDRNQADYSRLNKFNWIRPAQPESYLGDYHINSLVMPTISLAGQYVFKNSLVNPSGEELPTASSITITVFSKPTISSFTCLNGELDQSSSSPTRYWIPALAPIKCQAVFSGGTGIIEGTDIAVNSGQNFEIPSTSVPRLIRLIVTNEVGKADVKEFLLVPKPPDIVLDYIVINQGVERFLESDRQAASRPFPDLGDLQTFYFKMDVPLVARRPIRFKVFYHGNRTFDYISKGGKWVMPYSVKLKLKGPDGTEWIHPGVIQPSTQPPQRSLPVESPGPDGVLVFDITDPNVLTNILHDTVGVQVAFEFDSSQNPTDPIFGVDNRFRSYVNFQFDQTQKQRYRVIRAQYSPGQISDSDLVAYKTRLRNGIRAFQPISWYLSDGSDSIDINSDLPGEVLPGWVNTPAAPSGFGNLQVIQAGESPDDYFVKRAWPAYSGDNIDRSVHCLMLIPSSIGQAGSHVGHFISFVPFGATSQEHELMNAIHEIGHQLGSYHSPSFIYYGTEVTLVNPQMLGTPADPKSGWVNKDWFTKMNCPSSPYAKASIGVSGLSFANTILQPSGGSSEISRSKKDIMSYSLPAAGNIWISDYTYAWWWDAVKNGRQSGKVRMQEVFNYNNFLVAGNGVGDVCSK